MKSCNFLLSLAGPRAVITGKYVVAVRSHDSLYVHAFCGFLLSCEVFDVEAGGGVCPRMTNGCGQGEIVVEEAEVTSPRPTFCCSGSGIMQLTRATNIGLIWESNRSVIKDPKHASHL